MLWGLPGASSAMGKLLRVQFLYEEDADGQALYLCCRDRQTFVLQQVLPVLCLVVQNTGLCIGKLCGAWPVSHPSSPRRTAQCLRQPCCRQKVMLYTARQQKAG